MTIDRKAVAMAFLTPRSRLLLAKALEQMNAALEVLDEIGAPEEIGATLDLAIARIRRALGRNEDGESGLEVLFMQLQDELTRIQGGLDTRSNPWEISPVWQCSRLAHGEQGCRGAGDRKTQLPYATFDSCSEIAMPGPKHELAPQHAHSTVPEEGADKALALMVEALKLLDLNGGADIAGAHLDLAIHRLREWIAKEGD